MTGRLVLGRLAQAAFVLWAAFTVSFVLLQLMPGDAVLIRFVGGDMGLSPEAVAGIRAFYGADDPVWTQYLGTLAGFLRGDFGFSIASGASVAGEIAANLPATLWLSGLAFAAALVAGARRHAAGDADALPLPAGGLRRAAGLLVSIPVFGSGSCSSRSCRSGSGSCR